jgi:hypothetical protein
MVKTTFQYAEKPTLALSGHGSQEGRQHDEQEHLGAADTRSCVGHQVLRQCAPTFEALADARARAAEPGQAVGPDRLTAAWDNLQQTAGDRCASAHLLAVLQSEPSSASPSLNAA